MKRVFLFLILSVIGIAAAGTGDVTVTVTTAKGPDDQPTTTFVPDTGIIYALFKTKGGKFGDKIRGVLIAESVGDAARPNTKVFEALLDMQGDDGEFDFSKPPNGWPLGKYRVDIYLNDELVASARFTVEPAKERSAEE
jgi:hypothetical protein